MHGMQEVEGSNPSRSTTSCRARAAGTTSWALSSVGRALAWHARGRGFESRTVHQRASSSVWLERNLAKVEAMGSNPIWRSTSRLGSISRPAARRDASWGSAARFYIASCREAGASWAATHPPPRPSGGRPRGPLAQLGERLVRNEEVAGSSPARSTISSEPAWGDPGSATHAAGPQGLAYPRTQALATGRGSACRKAKGADHGGCRRPGNPLIAITCPWFRQH